MAEDFNLTDWLSELRVTNLLAVYDVVLDVHAELQMTEEDCVVLPLIPPVVRFEMLMPVDGISQRDRYCDLRWKAAHLLKDKDFFKEVDFLDSYHRWDGRLSIVPNKEKFDEFYSAIKSEYISRTSKETEVDETGIPVCETLGSDEKLRALFLRFHQVVIRLRERYNDRETLDVADEYDVQDLLHALLLLDFDDIRPEEWTPSYAGKSSRVDFLLKPERIVIEVKKTRKGLGAKELGDELIIDIARYSVMDGCEKLFCFIYDPENRVSNPRGFETDLSGERTSGEHNKLNVEVIVVPKQ